MQATFEGRFFEVCLNRERKDIMIKALDTYLDKLIERQASKSVIQKVTWLKEEIENMKMC